MANYRLDSKCGVCRCEMDKMELRHQRFVCYACGAVDSPQQMLSDAKQRLTRLFNAVRKS